MGGGVQKEEPAPGQASKLFYTTPPPPKIAADTPRRNTKVSWRHTVPFRPETEKLRRPYKNPSRWKRIIHSPKLFQADIDSQLKNISPIIRSCNVQFFQRYNGHGSLNSRSCHTPAKGKLRTSAYRSADIRTGAGILESPQIISRWNNGIATGGYAESGWRLLPLYKHREFINLKPDLLIAEKPPRHLLSAC